ncbi:MAG: 2-amino-4-hydroxy-6-hydroxymethyldihydropteridine diphosphokinase [Proteobacteria bacterium]|nr:2-amino-4-hydroxy-6-hydroxymethyldihydropteridine diphosphokinase [Pseudomonadota bacterium]
MNEVLIALGGNLGDVELAFFRARLLLRSELVDVRMSRLYRTDPVYDKPGATVPPDPVPAYLNAVMRAGTFLEPQSLLVRLFETERQLGRVRPAPECSPRTIDLDLLLYNDSVLKPEHPGDLELPHPRMHQRRFVLEPACDVAPGWIHPVLGKTLRDLLAQLG